MDKKYTLTKETKKVNGHTLYRIQALKDFGDIKKGDFGGWIEKEDNLSHEGNCWVYPSSCVYGDARVCGDDKNFGDARVSGNTQVADIVGGIGFRKQKAEEKQLKNKQLA
jgi:hypothetical protein